MRTVRTKKGSGELTVEYNLKYGGFNHDGMG